jgi:hypothetical protein
VARGWESKSVEMQQEEQASKADPGQKRDPEREQKIFGLEVLRRRLVFELEATGHPRLQDQKRRAIGHVDAQLAELRGANPPR